MKTYNQNTLNGLLITILIIGVTTTTVAANGGSGYSRYGLGDINYFVSSRAIGMGNAGLAVFSINSIDRINPAAWSKISRTRFDISGLYEGISTTDGKKSGYFGGMTFDGFMMGIPISVDNGIVLGLGLTPYSRINYHVIHPETYNGMDQSIEYLGDGGLSQGQIGISASLINDLYLGARINYYVGTLNYTTRQTLTTSDYTEVVRSMELEGFGSSIGVVYSGFKNLFHLPEVHSLNIGAVFSTTSYLSSTEEKVYLYQTPELTTRDTATNIYGKIRLPYAVGFGVSYSTDRFLFATDLFYQNWKHFTANGSIEPGLRDSYRLNAGGELLPKQDISLPFYKRMAYRLGFNYNSSYYQIKGYSINEIGITGGFGIPVFVDTRIDIGAEYILRGTTDQFLQKDKILRLTFTLSGGEFWFSRPEIE